MKKARVSRKAQAQARQQLRYFKDFLSTQDPEALALLAADVEKTIAAVASVEAWFQRYAAELKRRRVQ